MGRPPPVCVCVRRTVRALIPVADGTNAVEFVGIKDILERGGLSVVVASVTNDLVCADSPAQGCICREGAPEGAPAAVRQAVGGGCQSGWGRLLSVTIAIDTGTWREGDSGGA